MYLSLNQIILMLVKQQFEDIHAEQLIIISLIGIIIINMFIYIYTLITNKKVSIIQRIFIIMFIIYICFMYMITIEKREPGSRNEIHLMLDFGNLKGDFYQIQQAIYTLLNVAFFVPLGIILAMLQKHKKFFYRLFSVLMQSFLVSMIIEVMQLVTKRGYFETTDIVTNTTGGLIGGLIASVIIGIFCFRNKEH